MKLRDTTISNKDYSTITFDQLTKQLNLDADLIDVEFLESIIKAAVDWVEKRTNSYITPTIIVYTDYEFTGNVIELEHTGINNITSIKINDTTITGYKLIKKSLSTYIVLDSTINNKSELVVTYTSGDAPTNNTIQATLIVAADLYEADRSNYTAGLTNNRTVYRLLNLE